VGSSAFGFSLVYICFLVTGFLLTWGEFWSYLWQIGGSLITTSLVLSVIQVYVLEKFIGGRLLSDGYRIVEPRRWTLYAACMLCLSLSTGLLFALNRTLQLYALSLASIFRLDFTSFSPSFASLDAGFSAFMGVQMLWHRHHSPVLHVAHEAFACGAKHGGVNSPGNSPRPQDEGASQMSSNGSQSTTPPRDGASINHRARSRWHLAFTLHNNPAIQSERKHRLTASHEDAGTAVTQNTRDPTMFGNPMFNSDQTNLKRM